MKVPTHEMPQTLVGSEGRALMGEDRIVENPEKELAHAETLSWS